MPDDGPANNQTDGLKTTTAGKKLCLTGEPLHTDVGDGEIPDVPYGWMTIGWIGFAATMSQLEPLILPGIPMMLLACVFSLRSKTPTGKYHGFTLLGIIVCLFTISIRNWL